MAIGKSGRIIIEIDPKVKENLYLSMKDQRRSLKDWFKEKIRQDFPDLVLGNEEYNSGKVFSTSKTEVEKTS